jgi:hypothetical protein
LVDISYPVAVENGDALSDDDVPDERHGGQHSWKSDLVVECLDRKIVDLYCTRNDYDKRWKLAICVVAIIF